MPGVFKADFNGPVSGPPELGLTVACCSTGAVEMYPKPTSDGFGSVPAILAGSAKGDRVSSDPATGESTEVASANLATRGFFKDDVVDAVEFVRIDRVVTRYSLSSSTWANATFRERRAPSTMLCGETGSPFGGLLDMAAQR